MASFFLAAEEEVLPRKDKAEFMLPLVVRECASREHPWNWMCPLVHMQGFSQVDSELFFPFQIKSIPKKAGRERTKSQ